MCMNNKNSENLQRAGGLWVSAHVFEVLRTEPQAHRRLWVLTASRPAASRHTEPERRHSLFWWSLNHCRRMSRLAADVVRAVSNRWETWQLRKDLRLLLLLWDCVGESLAVEEFYSPTAKITAFYGDVYSKLLQQHNSAEIKGDSWVTFSLLKLHKSEIELDWSGLFIVHNKGIKRHFPLF